MRHVSAVLAVVVATAGIAHADDDDDNDPIYTPLPRISVGHSFVAHATRIGGSSEAGYGTALELALGIDRWQPFVEGSIATAGANSWTTPALETRVDGYTTRGGLGMRWLAREFEPDPNVGVELYLEAVAGLERYYWHDGSRMTRPDLGVGTGTQIRAYSVHGLTVRIDIRLLFTPSDRDGLWVSCRGATCPPVAQHTSSTGFMGGFGVAL